MQIIGHRGWRGKYPENSLIGFDAVSTIGVNAVEFDIIINKDKELIVSHEPWFDLNYCNAKTENNLFNLSLADIQKVDCGSKFYDRFPEQIKVPSVKPSFKSLVELWNYLGAKPFLALEIKSETKLYGSYQTFATEFAEKLIQFEEEHLVGFDYFVQSFDPFFLKVYHQLKPQTNTGLLIENKLEVEKDLDFLGYTPTFYNPEHILLTEKVMSEIKAFDMKTYTWTVNTVLEYNRIKDLPLEGIITDYPERFLS